MQIGIIKCLFSLFFSLSLFLILAFLRYRGKISGQGGTLDR